MRSYPEIAVMISTLAVIAIFTALSPNFLTLENIAGWFTMAGETGIMTVGASFLLICGEFDLSDSANYAMSGTVLGMLILNYGVSPELAVLVALAMGTFIGLFNGVVKMWSGIPSFITTMGSMFFLRGLILFISGGYTIQNYGTRIQFLDLINGLIAESHLFRVSAIWLILTTVVVAIFLSRHFFGNWVFATGGNISVARALGIPTRRVKIISFTICGFFASFSGVVAFSRINMIWPDQGQGMELEVLAAAVMGGTLLSGGRGSIIGGTIGALLVGMIRTGLILVGAPQYWYTAFLGIVLIGAAYINLKVYRVR